MQTNPELELAYQYVAETNRHLFLTGKAGTGKTTFLHRIREEIPKRMAVVAPTGVAAINAKGMTIHSLFQLPFGVLTPERTRLEMGKKGFTRKKINLFRGLDLLVIDEISMVRADVLDAIDVVLRRFRDPQRPFGGLQLLMIGDLHQLPPVVRDEDWLQLRQTYTTPYFFGSRALTEAPSTVVQLKHIYRQSDQTFIGLLNKVRDNRIDASVLTRLNARYQPTVDDKEGYITLTSHNATAQSINDVRLEKLKGKTFFFTASVEGDFPESMYPNEKELRFKVGAQVMFNRNDNYPDRLYYNGKIGVVSDIQGEEITVQCEKEDPIVVTPVTWENRKFSLNPTTKVVEENVVGTYEQHPLKLAWAITIHKSQGLTFEKVIIDAQSAFAHGQVYVALSRCKSFEGVILRTPIEMSSVRTDAVVRNYTETAEANAPTEANLRDDKRAYQTELLQDIFSFPTATLAGKRLHRVLLENEKSFQDDPLKDFVELEAKMEEKVYLIGHRFLPRLRQYCRGPELPVDNPELADRLDGAAEYFVAQLRDHFLPSVREFDVLTNNESIGQLVEERRKEWEKELFVKLRLFESLDGGFSPAAQVRAKADASIDFDKGLTRKTRMVKVPKNVKHRELYLQLVAWRKATAAVRGVKAYSVLSNEGLIAVAEQLPTGKRTLLAISGFGPKRYERYGKELVEIVTEYLRGQGMTIDLMAEAPARNYEKGESRLLSLEAFRSGKSISSIAAERELTEGTIRSHLFFWMQRGDVSPNELIDAQVLDTILPAINQHEGLKELYTHFGGKYTYNQLKIARWVSEQIGEEE